MAIELENEIELTDEMIEEARALEGTPVRIEQWNHEATLDTIRHYAWGVGDNNPLYCDEEYAAKGPYGTIIAPPTFLHSIHSGAMGLGMRGLQPIYAGTLWKFFDIVRRGDRFRADSKIGPIKVLEGTTAKRMVIQTLLTDYVREADGAIVATSEGRTFRIPRGKAAGGLSYQPREAKEWTREELEAIQEEAVAEPVRGAEPRYWEDVEVGEQLPRLVKGPIDLQTMTGYYAGLIGSPSMKSVEMRWLYRWRGLNQPELLPNNYDPSFYTELKSPGLGHIDPKTASEVGMPGAYGNGAQKAGWMGHIILNWMSDVGQMVELETRLQRPDIFGDVVYIYATVTDKPEPGKVELSIETINHEGTKTATGRAVVVLPQR